METNNVDYDALETCVLERMCVDGDTEAMVSLAMRLYRDKSQVSIFNPAALLDRAIALGSTAAESLKILLQENNMSGKRPYYAEKEEENVEYDALGSVENLEDEMDLEDDSVDTDEVDSLILATALYSRWKYSEEMERDEEDRLKAVGLYEKAVKEFENGQREMSDDLKEAIVILASYYDKSNKELSDKFIKIGAEAGQPTLCYSYGIYLQNYGRSKEAEQYYVKALDGEYSSVSAKKALAMLYLETPGMFHDNRELIGRYIREAMLSMEQAGKAGSNDYLLLMMLRGDFYRKLSKYKEAALAYVAAYKKIQLNPNFLSDDKQLLKLAHIAASNASHMYVFLNKAKEAQKYHQKALALKGQLK